MITRHFGNGSNRFFPIPITPSLDATATVGGNAATISTQIPSGILLATAPAAGAEILITHTHVAPVITYADLGFEAGGGGGGGGWALPQAAGANSRLTITDNEVVTNALNANPACVLWNGYIRTAAADPGFTRSCELKLTQWKNNGGGGSHQGSFGILKVSDYTDTVEPVTVGANDFRGVRILTDNFRALYSDGTGAANFSSPGGMNLAEGDVIGFTLDVAANSGSNALVTHKFYKNGVEYSGGIVSVTINNDIDFALLMYFAETYAVDPSTVVVRTNPADFEYTYPILTGWPA
jgi:hypothetical protein